VYLLYEKATSITTTVSSILLKYSNTSIPTDNTSVFDVSVAPCSGCDHVMTTFSVNGGQVYDDKSQLSLSPGEIIQSSLSTGESFYITQVNGYKIISFVRKYVIK